MRNLLLRHCDMIGLSAKRENTAFKRYSMSLFPHKKICKLYNIIFTSTHTINESFSWPTKKIILGNAIKGLSAKRLILLLLDTRVHYFQQQKLKPT